MEIDKSDYRRTHGREPRGRGLWMFQVGRHPDQTLVRASGTLTEALKTARRVAREWGTDYVQVLP